MTFLTGDANNEMRVVDVFSRSKTENLIQGHSQLPSPRGSVLHNRCWNRVLNILS